jgi:hypothetical protein
VPIEPGVTVTVRVTHLYQCSVPIVRRLLCRSLDSIRGATPRASDALAQAENPGSLDLVVDSRGRFTLMTAEATLPNQGAAYARGRP